MCNLLNPSSSPSRNCRIDGHESALFDADAEPRFIQKWFGEHPRYDKVVFSEQGWIHRSDQSMGPMDRFARLNGSFWHSYHTVLLVREPVERYVSHLRMLYNGDEQQMWAHARDERHLLLRRNFLTQHLVPGFRHDGGVDNCSDAVVARGKQVMAAYDFVGTVQQAARFLLDTPLPSRGFSALRRHEHHYKKGDIPSDLWAVLHKDSDCDRRLLHPAN